MELNAWHLVTFALEGPCLCKDEDGFALQGCPRTSTTEIHYIEELIGILQEHPCMTFKRATAIEKKPIEKPLCVDCKSKPILYSQRCEACYGKMAGEAFKPKQEPLKCEVCYGPGRPMCAGVHGCYCGCHAEKRKDDA